MDPIQLRTPGGDAVEVWACGQCRRVYPSDRLTSPGKAFDHIPERHARECCDLTCRECGATKRSAFGICDRCWEMKQERDYAERIAAAEKLDAWDGWVYAKGLGSKDGYFESLSGLLEWHADETSDRDDAPALPVFVFCCKEVPFRKVDNKKNNKNNSEASFEDAASFLDGVPELKASIDVFNEANVGLVSYEPDWTRVVRVSQTVAA